MIDFLFCSSCSFFSFSLLFIFYRFLLYSFFSLSCNYIIKSTQTLLYNESSSFKKYNLGIMLFVSNALTLVPCQSVSKLMEKPSDSTDRLTLPPISIMNDYLPTRAWVPPISSSPDSSTKSLPTPPQYDQWKSPPYKNRNELSRDTSYTYYNKTSPLLFSNTSPIMQQHGQTSPRQQQSIMNDFPESPKHQPQMRSSYFQYTSKAYHSNLNNTTSNNNIATSPSSSYSTSTNNSSRVDSEIEEVVRQCDTLRDTMLQRKSQFINSHSNTSSYQDLQSTRPLLDDMIGRANEVLNALLRLRKHQLASEQNNAQHQTNYSSNDNSNNWRMGPSSPSSSTVNYSNSNSNGSIRPRKRGKRPAFQGRCHSCNISSTPEWRRGPDGARTLCNACGLHYAKLARKQQEGRGMSTTTTTTSSSNASRRHSNYGGRSSGSIGKLTSPPPAEDIILDRSPTG